MRKLLGLLALCLCAAAHASAQQFDFYRAAAADAGAEDITEAKGPLRAEWLNDSFLKIPVWREPRASARR